MPVTTSSTTATTPSPNRIWKWVFNNHGYGIGVTTVGDVNDDGYQGCICANDYAMYDYVYMKQRKWNFPRWIIKSDQENIHQPRWCWYFRILIMMVSTCLWIWIWKINPHLQNFHVIEPGVCDAHSDQTPVTDIEPFELIVHEQRWWHFLRNFQERPEFLPPTELTHFLYRFRQRRMEGSLYRKRFFDLPDESETYHDLRQKRSYFRILFIAKQKLPT